MSKRRALWALAGLAMVAGGIVLVAVAVSGYLRLSRAELDLDHSLRQLERDSRRRLLLVPTVIDALPAEAAPRAALEGLLDSCRDASRSGDLVEPQPQLAQKMRDALELSSEMAAEEGVLPALLAELARNESRIADDLVRVRRADDRYRAEATRAPAAWFRRWFSEPPYNAAEPESE